MRIHFLYTQLLYITSVTAYNIVPQANFKKTLFFYPARVKQSIPSELYHTFLDSLKQMYNVKVADQSSSIERINTIKDEGNILLLSHSTGANDLINDYKSLPSDINKKAIMIDPLDFQKFSSVKISQSGFNPFDSFSFFNDFDMDKMDDNIRQFIERDYKKEAFTYIRNKFSWSQEQPSNDEEDKMDTKEISTGYNSEILLIRNKKSSEWRFFPVVPPLYIFKKEFEDLINTTITEKEIVGYTHFDIFDRTWANGINKMFLMRSNDNEPISEKTIKSYADTVLPAINDFYDDS